MTRIKVCGITNVVDAQMVTAAGASYVGVIFAPTSPRCVAVSTACNIARSVNTTASMVGVFKDQPLSEVLSIVEQVPLDLVQLHGSENHDYCRKIPKPVIKTVELSLELLMGRLKHLQEHAQSQAAQSRYLLFDRPKGLSDSSWLSIATARIFEISASLPEYFFAGGLSPENVRLVINMLKPFGVDIASGVESAAGLKDPVRVEKFCHNVLGTRQGAR